jgi:hypothetical protein
MVFLSRGRYDASAIINAGFAAASKHKNGFLRQRQEEYKGKTLYVLGSVSTPTTTTTTVSSEGQVPAAKANLSARVVVTEEAAPVKQNEPEQQKTGPGEAQKTAVTALDSNTIAAGDLESVRATVDAIDGGSRVDDELVQLATRNTSALVGFSGKQPSFLVQNPGRNPNSQDPYAKSLESIRQYYGSFSTSGTDMESSLNLRTQTPEQARDIKELISTLKLAEGVSNKPSSPPMVPDISSFLKTLTVNVEGNEVQLQLKFTQADLMPFIPRM